MRLISGLLLLSLAMACGKKDDDSGTAPADDNAGRLEASELAAPANITVMSKSTLQDEFDYGSYLVPHSSVPTIGCSTEQISQTTISVVGNSLRVARTFNTAQCYIDFLNGIGAINSTVAASASVYSEIVCTGVDVSSFNGTKAQDFDPNTICVNGYSYLENIRATSNATANYQGQPVTIAYSSISAKSTADNQPCVVTVGLSGFYETGCIEIESVIDTGTEPYVDYLKRTHKDLVWSKEPTTDWYTSGSMDLAINNWTGAITYSGATSSPTYSLSNGTETLTGSFTATALRDLSKVRSPFPTLNR
ncbi:MAG: hypothetical protein EOP07_13540 [Proteobacteria bacterium]|nr:MAG: hypothetical protein EOP07_13540 [Pseudomonadota bacterium]